MAKKLPDICTPGLRSPGCHTLGLGQTETKGIGRNRKRHRKFVFAGSL